MNTGIKLNHCLSNKFGQYMLPKKNLWDNSPNNATVWTWYESSGVYCFQIGCVIFWLENLS